MTEKLKHSESEHKGQALYTTVSAYKQKAEKRKAVLDASTEKHHLQATKIMF